MTVTNNISKTLITTLILATVLCLAVSAIAQENQVKIIETSTPQELRIVSGKSMVLDTGSPVTRVSLATQDHAEIVLLSPTQVYITGTAPGVTNLTMWGADDAIIGIIDLEITPDVTSIKRMIHEVLPQETEIKVLTSGESVALSGRVSTAQNLNTALAIAEAAAPEQVVNLMSVGGVHQVMLEVKVAEMTRSVMRRLGFNFKYFSGQDVMYTFLNRLTYLDEEGKHLLSSNVNAYFTGSHEGTQFSGFVDALKTNGLIRVLAEPNLVCMSGESAEFLAGGEIPIPVPQGLGSVAIEYKPFGVGLKFTPIVLDSGHINLKVEPEVSDIDQTRGITMDSFSIPAITSRRASTTVELADGQSFAIAGLINESLRENSNRFPLLGDLPILGTLFSSNDFLSNESELIIIVTPHLAKPLDMQAQTLPTDGFQEPNDFEFYMLGLLEGQPDSSTVDKTPVVAPNTGQSGFDGDYGHIPPQ